MSDDQKLPFGKNNRKQFKRDGCIIKNESFTFGGLYLTVHFIRFSMEMSFSLFYDIRTAKHIKLMVMFIPSIRKMTLSFFSNYVVNIMS